MRLTINNLEKIRLKEEEYFFNDEYSKYSDSNLLIQEKMIKKYLSPRDKPIDWREWSAVLMGNLKDKVIFDYGCGTGEESVYFAKQGATVYAIDISPIGIEIANKRMKINGVENKVNAQVMDVISTKFKSETFDIIYGIGILHHLDIDKATEEIWRLLKKDGKAIFLEPVINSKLMTILKKMIPVKKMAVTDFEKSLVYADIERIGKKFKECQYWEFSFLARLNKFIHNEWIIDFLKILDYFIFKYFKFFRHYASGVVIELVK